MINKYFTEKLKKAAEEKQEVITPEILGSMDDHKPVSMSFNTSMARQARDMAHNVGGTIHKKDLEKQGINIKKTGIEHLVNGKGYVSGDDIQNHIDTLPKMQFNTSHSDYGSESSSGYEDLDDYLDQNGQDVEDYIGSHEWIAARDEAYEEVSDNNPISQFIKENHSFADLVDKNDGHQDQVADYLKEAHDWEGPNPDHNPEDEDSKETIDFNDDLVNTIQDHPEYASREQSSIDDYWNQYLQNGDHYDDFYDEYQEHIQDDVDEKHNEKAKEKADDRWTYDENSYEGDPEDDAESEQRHSTDMSDVLQVNYTPEHKKSMEDAGVYDTFRKMLDRTRQGGHPVTDDSLGWIRYTQGNDGTHIDEVQSDFGQAFIKIKDSLTNAVSAGQLTNEQAEAKLAQAKADFPPEHLEQINKILFDDKHPSEVLHEVFKQKLRDSGMNIGKNVAIWGLDGKQLLAGQSPEPKLPKTHSHRSFKELSPEVQESYLSNAADKRFGDRATPEQKQNFMAALRESYTTGRAKSNRIVINKKTGLPEASPNQRFTTEFKQAPVHMRTGYDKLPKAMGYKKAKYGELQTQHGSHTGKETWQKVLRKKEDNYYESNLNNSEPRWHEMDKRIALSKNSHYSLFMTSKGAGDAILNALNEPIEKYEFKRYFNLMLPSLEKSHNIRTEDRMFVAMDGDNIGASVERAAMADDLDTIISQSELIFSGQRMIREWANKFEADIYIDGGDDIAFTLPTKYVLHLDDLKSAYNDTTGFTITMGIGNTISQAGHAMLYGKLHGKNQINEWSPELDETLESISRELSPVEKLQDHGLLGKSQIFIPYAKNEDDEMDMDQIDTATEAKSRQIPTLTDYSEHIGKKVFVYFNLHKKLWSVRHKGKVLFHTNNLHVDTPELKVSEAGRQRVLRDKAKNVHAGVNGVLGIPEELVDGTQISYNPYKGGQFFHAHKNPETTPVHHADKVSMALAQITTPDGNIINVPAVHARNPTHKGSAINADGTIISIDDTSFGSETEVKKTQSHIMSLFEDLIKNDETVDLVHYGRASGLSHVDPNSMGDGARGAEYKYGTPETKRSYFYRAGSMPESVVTSGAKARYTAKLTPDQKLYDLGTDEDGIYTQMKREAQGRQVNPGMITTDQYLQAVKDAGYHGFHNSRSALPEVVALFHPHPVEEDNTYRKNEKDGYGNLQKTFNSEQSRLKNQIKRQRYRTSKIRTEESKMEKIEAKKLEGIQAANPKYTTSNDREDPTSPTFKVYAHDENGQKIAKAYVVSRNKGYTLHNLTVSPDHEHKTEQLHSMITNHAQEVTGKKHLINRAN